MQARDTVQFVPFNQFKPGSTRGLTTGGERLAAEVRSRRTHYSSYNHAPLCRASSVMYLCFRGMQGKEGDGVPPQVLAEIPEQLLGFMASKGIKPNPPPAVVAVQANAPPAYQPPAVAPVMATAVAR